MAWFGESLSSLTGHLQNLTKEVLSEATDETKAASGDLKATTEKLEELEALCTAQDLEITALKKQNAELRRRLEQAGGLEDEGQVVLPPAPTTWLSIEQRCDAAYAGGVNGRGGASGGGVRGHTRALSDATAVSAKHQERLEKELKERIQLIEHLQMQLKKVEEERHMFSLRTSELEQQVQQLVKQANEENLLREKQIPALQNEEKLIQENNELKRILDEENKRSKELEEELLSMRNQCLDHVIDSQINTSELRLDVEQTRKRISNEAGVQRAEKLRAHQDMVNRMIQMGEKSRETEENVKRLQAEDKKLAADMALKIQKLGDQEQQDLIHGTLKALELENQVLNMRNAQLERESMKDMGIKIDERKSLSDGIEYRPRSEPVKLEEDVDNMPLQSENSDVTMPNQRLENQIAQLQTQVEIYKRDVKHYEMVRDDLSREKMELEEQVNSLKEQLKEKQDIPNPALLESLSTSSKTVVQNKLAFEESVKIKELQLELKKLSQSLQSAQEEKLCLGQELEAMARVVQDLEATVAHGEDERRELETSMEELDQQHQDAIDKLLGLRNAELAENEVLKFQLQELQMSASSKPPVAERNVQTDIGSSNIEEGSTQTDCIQYDQENQTVFIQHDKDTLTEFSEDKEDNDSANFSKFDLELSEKIRNLVNFELPNHSNQSIPQSLLLVQEIIKVVNDCKWKKDTLERKVAELIRENKEYKSTITILETECCNLKENVERLAEQLVGLGKSNGDALPTILENSEELEVLEQRNVLLEEEIAVLRETRSNLEQDAVRMREDREDLLGRIRNLEAQQKNHENLHTELQRRVEDAENSTEAYKAAAEMANGARNTAEEKLKALTHELEVNTQNYEQKLTDIQEHARNLEIKNEELLNSIGSKESDIIKLQNRISELETEINSLKSQMQQNNRYFIEIEQLTEENKIFQNKLSELQLHLEDSSNLKVELVELKRNVEETMKSKLELEHQLNFTTRNLRDAQSLLEEQMTMKNECSKWQNVAEVEEQKVKATLEMVSRLKEENKVLHEKISEEESTVNSLVLEKEQLLREIDGLENKKSELIWENNEQVNFTFEDLNTEITSLKKEKVDLEECLASALQQQDLVKFECESQQSQLLQMEQIETQLRETISALRVQTNDVERKLKAKYESEFSEIVQKLKNENERLRNEILVSETNGPKSVKQIHHVNSFETQLSSLTQEKEILMDENTKLKAALLEHQNSKSINIVHENFQPDISMERTSLLGAAASEIINKERPDDESEEMISSLLNEKIKEINSLQLKVNELSTALVESKEKIEKLELLNEVTINEKLQYEEKLGVTKETVTKLSEMIKEKDQELHEMKDELSQLRLLAQKVDDLNKQLKQAHEFRTQAIQERDQLLQTVHVKHQESIQYHGEIQRLSALLSQELTKNQQLAAQYNALVQQCNEERESALPKHQQELKELQDLIKVKDDGLQQLCNRLELKEQELQARGMEMEMLQHQMGTMSQERMQLANPDASRHQNEESQEKYKEVLSKFQDEQRKGKNLQNELEICLGREMALQKELERLRVHLVEIEDTYTQEALKSEEHVKELSSKLQQAEDMVKSSSTVYKSANIRANQQVETLQEQARLIAQQRDDVQLKLSSAEDQVAKHAAALRNLQAVLEQFQRDREREIEAARASVYVKVEAAQRRNDELLGEISSLKKQLNEAKEGLSAASRLGEELEKKTEIVNRLKQEVLQLDEKALKAEEKAKLVGQTVEGKVDKSLVKNVVLGFFLAPSNTKEQVLHVVASVLDFSEDEKGRVQKILGFHGSEGSGGWFKSLLHPSGQEQRGNNQSLSEAFVRFLENESIPQPRLKMLPDTDRPTAGSSNSPNAMTPNNAQRKSPLLLADVQLPTFVQFPVGRNSSSILKDILKES